jgi:hypothetical protein
MTLQKQFDEILDPKGSVSIGHPQIVETINFFRKIRATLG